MFTLVQNCIRSRELLFSLSESYLKARYKQTILGAAWAIVPPILLLLTVTLLLPNLSNSPEAQPYPLFVYIGIWMWTFFANALSFAIPNLVQNTPLLRKVYFPRELLVVAAIVPSLVDFALGIPVLVLLLWYYHIPVSVHVFLLPLIFLVELLLVIGVSCAGAILNVAFRDVSKFLPILLQILLLSTPVIYATEMISMRIRPYIAFNPLAGLINASRAALLPGYTFHWKELLIAAAVSVIVCYLGTTLFRMGERVIADIA